MIIYGQTPEQIARQKACEHYWLGPCIDNVSRYYKCTDCYCLDRDVEWEEAVAEYGAALVQAPLPGSAEAIIAAWQAALVERVA